jgi:hypothetical protein
MSPPLSGMPFSASMSFMGMGMHPLPNSYISHMPGIFRGPPKKEIKRRTKTGCMTCRRRRIKCDETRPSCQNCRKSKRDCQGYEHVVRQNPTTPGQPPSMALHHHHRGPQQASTPLISPNSPDAVGDPFNNQHSVSGGYNPAIGSPNIGYEACDTTTSSPAIKSEPYDYSPIDPALQTPVSVSHSQPPSYFHPHPSATTQAGQRPPTIHTGQVVYHHGQTQTRHEQSRYDL